MSDTPLDTRDMICFALYSASHAMTRIYRPLLADLGLTYPQLLVLVALWAEDGRRVSDLGDDLALESNTLTPLLRRMEQAGLVTKTRDAEDERVVRISLTAKGRDMRAEADRIAACVFDATGLSQGDLVSLRDQVFALRDNLRAAS
ncbi:MAG: MarR family transcriptional regulator [Rhodobacteraceae bacterium]|nr:MarR family transcriptional regulator [Paracoccaceae bacterium]MAY46144.1 MarR family transcriptional regulator [Paracoccaceae bacterium]QEW22691.1 Organic hydroperoxide resistance transcriptional regulator [Marinibacterium anthonyi]